MNNTFMSKKSENPEVAAEQPQAPVSTPLGEDTKISLSLGELKSLLATTNGNSQDNVLTSLVAALDNLRKPYEDPAQKANREAARKAMRDLIERQKIELANARDNCVHTQGCNPLSEKMGDMSSLIFHTLDTGEMIGLCTVCQKTFRSDDPEYQVQMRRKSGNRPSAAGRRFFADPLAAIAAGRQ